MKRNFPRYYPDTDVAISSPFFCVECQSCSGKYWSIVKIDQCSECSSSSILCYPAGEKDKVSQKNA